MSELGLAESIRTAPDDVVVIDDERTFRRGTVHLRSSADATAWLEANSGCAELWFDHDLGGADTTRPVAMWLAERAFNGDPCLVGLVYVHSMNPVGRAWLVSTLRDHHAQAARYRNRHDRPRQATGPR